MTYYINYAPVVEEILVTELLNYFSELRWDEIYPNHPLRIGNEHPWVPYITEDGIDLSQVQETLFPSITIGTDGDEKSPDFIKNIAQCVLHKTELSDLTTELAKTGYMYHPDLIDELTIYFESEDDLYGLEVSTQRRDVINIDIITDDSSNIRNRIYDHVILFLTGKKLVDVFTNQSINIIENTLRGRRFPEYNIEFGRLLRGSTIQFQVDYVIQQNIYETDIATISGVEITATKELSGGS